MFVKLFYSGKQNVCKIGREFFDGIIFLFLRFSIAVGTPYLTAVWYKEGNRISKRFWIQKLMETC